ncbi:MAG: short-chain fatty acid transporter [Phycisphaerales bacterium]|nr:MAG: short-chain fatty acid transporter [Phycisphaerales bacterium]
MIARLGLCLSSVFRRTAPEPFVLAVLLTILTALLAVAFGTTGEGAADRAIGAFDAWRSGDGLWRFLAFSMQMCLILVTGYALACSRPAAAMIARLAALPRTGASAAAIVALVAMTCGLVNWGLGLIVGALLAREVGRSCAQRGVAAHYPLLAAAGYTGMLVWHGGLSGSAPLTMTTRENAARVLDAETLERFGGEGVPLSETLGSTLNLVGTGGLLMLVPLVLVLLMPKKAAEIETIDRFMSDPNLPEKIVNPEPVPSGAADEVTWPDRLSRSRVLAWFLGLLFLAGVVRTGVVLGPLRVGLDEINMLMLGLGLMAHASLGSYGRAVEEGARGCAGVILQFPLYAGIMAMVVASGLAARLAGGLAEAAGDRGLPVATFFSAGIVNLFVPSGGGQWGIQGPIALESGVAAGIEPGSMIMAVAFGDQLTNMLQPFWALPLLAITGVRARDVVGYTAVVMVAGGAWLGLTLLVLA